MSHWPCHWRRLSFCIGGNLGPFVAAKPFISSGRKHSCASDIVVRAGSGHTLAMHMTQYRAESRSTSPRFVRKWFAEWTASSFGRATYILNHLIRSRPTDAWERILALIGNAPSEEALGWVAAGPLEDLLCKHGPAMIDRIEREAGVNARLAHCLTGVWGFSRMDRDVWSRVLWLMEGEARKASG